MNLEMPVQATKIQRNTQHSLDAAEIYKRKVDLQALFMNEINEKVCKIFENFEKNLCRSLVKHIFFKHTDRPG